MCEYWVHFCIQCFRFGKKLSSDACWVLCWWQILMLLVAGYFRLGDELPKPVWTYPVSYLSFYTYAIQVFLELIFVCVFHQIIKWILFVLDFAKTRCFQSTWRTHWGEGVDDGCHSQGLLENEYTGVTFTSNIPNAPAISPQVTLQTTFQVPKARIGKWENILILAGMAIGYRVLTSISLILFQALTLHKHTTSRTSSRPSQDE